jgi:SOS-response transcriptional repressor LexA
MRQRTNSSKPERCKQVLDFYKSYYFEYRTWPGFGEIMKGTGLKSRGHVSLISDQLLEEGKLEREPGPGGHLRIPHHSLFSVPYKGLIAANNASPEIVFDQDPDAVIEILPDLMPDRLDHSNVYALKVHGDSMSAALIGDGDTVLIREGDSYNEGDIVAVWLVHESAVTLKKIHQGRPGVIKLKPKSHKHQTRVEKQEDIKILGRIVGVIRKYN